jgi:hypothetical protein
MRVGCLVFALGVLLCGRVLVVPPASAGETDSLLAVVPGPPPGPRLFTDLVVVGGFTAFYTVANPSVRTGFFSQGSFGEVIANFRSPLRRAIEGAREDQDPFVTNYVAHPVSWAFLGLYLKERGHSGLSALLFSQAHSVVWEYVIEGKYQKPSGKDLITNLAGASFAIFAAHGLAERAAQREDKRLVDRLALLLNPLRPLRRAFAPGGSVELAAVPDPAGGSVAVVLAVGW